MGVTGGAPLSVFNDFMSTTGPLIFTGDRDIINEATIRSYTLGRFLIEDDMGQLVQGGSRIRDFILKDDASTYTHYRPGAMHTFQQPQVIQDWEINWRFSIDHMAWTQQEVLMQITGDMTREARFQVYKQIRRKLEMRAWTSIINGMERDLWAVPNKAEMEDQDGTTPYSLPVHCNEYANGLFVEDGSNAWTTVQGINPVTDPYWVPQQVGYSFSNPLDTNNQNNGIVAAFEEMSLYLDFDPLPKMPEMGEDRTRSKWIVTSNSGVLWYKLALRKLGDRGYVINPQDPAYTNPVFSGIPIERSEILETAPLYSNGQTGGNHANVPWDQAGVVGPRFYFFCTEYMKMIFHQERYYHRHPVDSHPNQVGTYRQPIEVWHNLACRSRRRGCGIVYPTS